MKKLRLHAVVAASVLGLASGAALAHEDYSEAGVMHWLEHVQATPASATAPVQLVTAAVAPPNTAETYMLKDGSALYVFKDGKMGMEDRLGRALSMKEGQTMETADGQSIVMKGNEVWRVREAHRIHRGG